MTDRDHKITDLLLAWRSGDPEAPNRLMPLVYDQLRLLASRYLRQEDPGHTLRTTDLVHEAYLKLFPSGLVGDNRVYFMAIMAITMRRILVDHARAHRRSKRGSGATRVAWDEALLAAQSDGTDLLDLDFALNRLSLQDPRKARLIELLYFGGLKCDEAAVVLEISTATVNRDLKLAKAWLRHELRSAPSSGPLQLNNMQP
jgi:RNA polymerase sigma factor (TIGR02999 family)